MRLQRCAAMQVGSIMSMSGLVLGLMVSLLTTPVAISKAKPAGGPTAENALAAEQEIARAMANPAQFVGAANEKGWLERSVPRTHSISPVDVVMPGHNGSLTARGASSGFPASRAT